jgi:hypothetical protein
VRWKGVKWNWVLVVIRLVFKTPQVRASSSDLVRMEFVSYFTRCYGTYSINHLTGNLSLLPIDRTLDHQIKKNIYRGLPLVH